MSPGGCDIFDPFRAQQEHAAIGLTPGDVYWRTREKVQVDGECKYLVAACTPCECGDVKGVVLGSNEFGGTVLEAAPDAETKDTILIRTYDIPTVECHGWTFPQFLFVEYPCSLVITNAGREEWLGQYTTFQETEHLADYHAVDWCWICRESRLGTYAECARIGITELERAWLLHITERRVLARRKMEFLRCQAEGPVLIFYYSGLHGRLDMEHWRLNVNVQLARSAYWHAGVDSFRSVTSPQLELTRVLSYAHEVHMSDVGSPYASPQRVRFNDLRGRQIWSHMQPDILLGQYEGQVNIIETISGSRSHPPSIYTGGPEHDCSGDEEIVPYHRTPYHSIHTSCMPYRKGPSIVITGEHGYRFEASPSCG